MALIYPESCTRIDDQKRTEKAVYLWEETKRGLSVSTHKHIFLYPDIQQFEL